ncbi:MAG: RNA pyrophosphohydrolase [Alphaproteobacteria bacterium]|nr:RNA pyrophosphohydrolase [Alphaproteobacteria bacterium]
MIINTNKKVWLGLRSDAHLYTDCATQMPQGGIDKGETPEQAAWREMYEEVGLTPKTAKLIAESSEWFCYDFPDYVMKRMPTSPFIGQRQKWFLFQLTGTDADFDLHACNYDEFSSFQWIDLDQIPDNVVAFKQEVYRQVCAYFKPIVDTL